MKAITKRQAHIVEIVERRGYVSVERLADHLKVTTQTVRRDINELCENGLLERQHGGVSLLISKANSSYGARQVEAAAEKKRIGECVVEFIGERATLFLSLGTTVEAVANALAKTTKPALIVTNSTEIAHMLWRNSSIETVLTGGLVQHRNGGLVGPRAIECISHYRCDYLISSAGSVEPDGAVLDFYDAEIAVVTAMRSHARNHILVADSRKFQTHANQKLCAVSDLTAIITESPPPPAIVDIAQSSDVQIVLSRQQPATDAL